MSRTAAYAKSSPRSRSSSPSAGCGPGRSNRRTPIASSATTNDRSRRRHGEVKRRRSTSSSLLGAALSSRAARGDRETRHLTDRRGQPATSLRRLHRAHPAELRRARSVLHGLAWRARARAQVECRGPHLHDGPCCGRSRVARPGARQLALDDLHFDHGPLGKIHVRFGKGAKGSGPRARSCRCSATRERSSAGG